ncbi:MAG: gamma carbonic anhydrase family protein [Acidobacteria bacterium]|nr:gamma carbonic anhydrase family protein [Acidobacteriota bacterium]
MIRSFQSKEPRIASTAYIDESALIIGDVVIGEHSSVWPKAVLRGDVHYVRIGNETNIQDNCVLHVETGQHALEMGDRITVGHGAILHGCRIGSRCLIGMGSIILNNAEIGSDCIVAAGTLIPENTVIPSGSLCMGVPGVVRRKLTEAELQRIHRGADNYLRLKNLYIAERRGVQP